MRPSTHVTSRVPRLLAAGTLVLAALAVGAYSSHRAAAQSAPAAGAATAAGATGPLAFMRFAGAGDDDHSAQIFTRSPAGAVRQLTHLVGGAFNPTWSPDGARIAFERWFARQRNPDQLFTMKADGTDVRPLTSGCERSGCLGDDWPSYSPDGSKIAFVRNKKPLIRSGSGVDRATAADLMVVASGGGAPTLLQHFGEDPQPSAPAWSPDGAQLVLALSTVKQPTKHTPVLDALFVLDVAGAAMRQITPWALGASDPDYSPDGKLIVFSSQAGHSPLVYVVRPDGGGLRRITHRTPVHSRFPDDPSTAMGAQWQPSWSPDGRQIVFTREARPCASRHVNGCPRRNVANNLFVMDADGTHVHRLTKSPRMEAQPAWAPAG